MKAIRFPCGGGGGVTLVCGACVPAVLDAEGATLGELGAVPHEPVHGEACEGCSAPLAPLARVYARSRGRDYTVGVRLADGREARAIGRGPIADGMRACMDAMRAAGITPNT